MLISELRTSSAASQYDVAASVPNPEGGRRLFDTHAVVRLFEENGLLLSLLNSRRRRHSLVRRADSPFAPAGFTSQQAEAMVKILVRMTQSNMDVIYGDMVTKVQQVRSDPPSASLPTFVHAELR